MPQSVTKYKANGVKNKHGASKIIDTFETYHNARIAPLEAELNASREAWDVATTAKVAAKKTAKSAETKAKTAEKALTDAD
jgi:hypothetical protein